MVTRGFATPEGGLESEFCLLKYDGLSAVTLAYVPNAANSRYVVRGRRDLAAAVHDAKEIDLVSVAVHQ